MTAAAGRPQPRLIGTRVPDAPVAAVLVLHGGGGRASMPVSPTQLSVLRMIPIAGRIARAGHGRLAVFRLLNAVRGLGRDPLANVCWALEQIGDRYPDVPVGLVGHSLGGSVALAAGGETQVRSVVALAPWLSGSESPSQLGDTPTLIVHGDGDRVTNPVASQHYCAQARRAGTPASFVGVTGGEHTMLKRRRGFDVLAAHYARATLDSVAPLGRGELAELAWRARDHPGEFTW